MVGHELQHLRVVDPGEDAGGITASRWECARALGHTRPAQASCSSAGGVVQQRGSGHPERPRAVLSRPRIHFTCAKGTPRLTENRPAEVCSTIAVRQ